MINRLELHLRGIAARVLGSPLSRQSLPGVLSRLERVGVLSSDEKLALDTFLGVGNDLLLVHPAWAREEDYKMVARFGVELLAKHSGAPSLLDQGLAGAPRPAERTGAGAPAPPT